MIDGNAFVFPEFVATLYQREDIWVIRSEALRDPLVVYHRSKSSYVQNLKTGDFLLFDPGSEDRPSKTRGIDARTFFATYEIVPGTRFWHKTAGIWAVQMDEPFTVTADNSTTECPAGDWLVQNLDIHGVPLPGDRYRMTTENLTQRYGAQ